MTPQHNKQGNLTGWEIQEAHISVHEYIHYPEDWMITCRPLQIFAKPLCKKDITNEAAIARHINVMLTGQINEIESRREIIVQYT